ncbi:MAG TPA: sugar phosphate isomerase/epimerase family protein [Phycisphaerae bacterium]|nr:sugar phosphate isomerase/epimerase family protein [Phycisphaerae bacterium]
MSVQLGTVAPIGFDDFPPDQWLPCMRQLGCTVVQAYRNTEVTVPLQQMRDAIAASGAPCDSVHGVFGEQFDPSAPLESARRFAVDTFKAEGELARELGGSLVVVHCSTIRRDGVSPKERAQRVEQLRKSMLDLGFFGQQINVRYAFENLPAYHPVGSDMVELADILKQANAPNTGICFDSGHANMVGDPAQSVLAAGERIIYVHLNDNSGGADEHLMPTYGAMDTVGIARSLHEVGYDGTLMLEVFYSVDELRKFIDGGCAERLRGLLNAANGRGAA